MEKVIYLDNAATTKTAHEVVEAMLPYFTEYYGNPSSIYSAGSEAKKAVNQARETIAKTLNAAGIYGLFAILAIWIGPFLQIGGHYLLLKATGAVCSIFACKESTELVRDFTSAMGLLLAMTGTICLMLLISLVCFLRGVG